MRRATVILLLAVAALAAGLTAGRDGDAPAEAATALVVRVVDGDTVRVALGGREEPVRYIGIDTPETVRPDTPVRVLRRRAAARERAARRRPARAPRARRRASATASGGCSPTSTAPRDGRFVNAALVRSGYARTLTIAPNVRFAARFARLAARGPPRRARALERVRSGVVACPRVAQRLRQSLAQLERAFVEEIQADRERRERQLREAQQRLHRRHRERTLKAGSMRFWVLVLVCSGPPSS